jgi:hypothetical protein
VSCLRGMVRPWLKESVRRLLDRRALGEKASVSSNSRHAAARLRLAPFAGRGSRLEVKEQPAQGHGLPAVPAAGETLSDYADGIRRGHRTEV